MTTKAFATLAASPKASPEKPPLTEAEVSMRRNEIQNAFLLTRRQLLSLRTYHTLVGALGVGCTAAVFLVTAAWCAARSGPGLYSLFGEGAGFLALLLVILAMALLTVGATGLFAKLIGGHIDAAAALAAEYEGYEPMEDSWCAEMLRNCAATPEGQRYRQKVLEQGRQFYGYEHEMMRQWVSALDHREACRALYDLTQETPSEAA